MSEKLLKFSEVKKEFFWVKLTWHYFAVLMEFLISFSEMHMVKIVSVAIMAMCCFNVNAIHMVIAYLLILSFVFGVYVVQHSFHLIGLMFGLLLITKLMYQTKFIEKTKIVANCSAGEELSFADGIRWTLSDLQWLGYQLLEKEESIVHLWGSYLVVLLVMTFRSIVSIRQRLKRLDKGQKDVAPDVPYPDVTRKMADENCTLCLKFLLNYGFYKFGIEITLTVAAFVIALRTDVFSVFYSFWLFALFPLRRASVSRLWPIFHASVMLCILWQYAMAVGLSPLICFEYPWGTSYDLSRWLFLPSYEQPPDGRKILSDFILMICTWRQKIVFKIEKKNVSGDYPGGSNAEVILDPYVSGFMNPVPDQTVFDSSLLRWIINFVVTSMLWITLAFVYWSGVNNVNILSLGYLVGAFIFLWVGHDIFLWPLPKILKWWNALLAYLTLVIALKCLHKVLGCIYIQYLRHNFCWLLQLLSLGCSNMETLHSTKCVIGRDTVLYWDAACFGLMLFQRRIFFTYYFLHKVEDVRSLANVQSIGARLIDELIQNHISESEKKERKTLEKIKTSMKRMKEWQKSIQGPHYIEPQSHTDAVHMGDYYMFEDIEEREKPLHPYLDVSEEDDESDNEKEEPEPRKKAKKLTMNKFIETVFKKTTEVKALKKRRREGDSGKKAVGEKSTESRASVGTSKVRFERVEGEDHRDKSDDVFSDDERDPRLKKAAQFLKAFFDSICVTMIKYFDKQSRDYRLIDTAMKEERKTAKETLKKSRSTTSSVSRESRDSDDSRLKVHTVSVENSQTASILRYDGLQKQSDSGSIYVELILSMSFFVMSHTEFFCFLTIFFHQTLSPTLISAPLPLCALLWGSLSSVRPTSTFWIVLIAYTEVMVLIKAVFQNYIFPWNDATCRTLPYHPPLLLGIHRDKTYATADLFLLFMLFLHRYKLKRWGMWNRTNEEDTIPPQNFGVYNEIVSEKENAIADDVEYDKKSENIDFDGRNQKTKLDKWKCTSRAMAVVTSRRGKVKVKFAIREIEGPIMVTEGGRRLLPLKTTAAKTTDKVTGGDIILRVHSNADLRSIQNKFYILSWLQHLIPMRKFFLQISDRKDGITADFYTFIFIMQFIAFLLVFFGFSNFTERVAYDPEEHFYFTENQIPLTYLTAVLLHFMVIIIDRILYLRKNIVGKLSLQLILVILVHLWMFVILPSVTGAYFTELTLPQIYYLVMCLYFLMSAYQIRVGYPMRVQGHFLCKKYGSVNYFFYKTLQFIPFFNQVRTLLGYLCIQSSFNIGEWIKMESIYQLVFENKCVRRASSEYPTPRGVPYPKCKKYVPGTCAIVSLIGMMWLPFFIFAIFDTVSIPNRPQSAAIHLTIASYGSVYRTTSEYEGIIPFKYSDYEALKGIYRDNKKIWSFLSNYKFEDVTALKFRFTPLETWQIMKNEFNRLNATIQEQNVDVPIYIKWQIIRTHRSQTVGPAEGHKELVLERHSPLRNEFIDAFRGKGNEIFIPNILPKFIQVTVEGRVVPVSGFFNPRHRSNPYRNITLQLTFTDSDMKYWTMTELADDDVEDTRISKIPYQDKKFITMYIFSHKSVPNNLVKINRTGIIGLYLSIVFVVWNLVKRMMIKYPTIMYDEMPNVDGVLQLCHDIYLARACHEFALEEDLYARLLFLFRSPETLIKFTRIRETH